MICRTFSGQSCRTGQSVKHRSLLRHTFAWPDILKKIRRCRSSGNRRWTPAALTYMIVQMRW